MLSQRLRELEEGGIVRRRKVGAASYELTEWGRELHPILLQLGRWGARSPIRPEGTPPTPDAIIDTDPGTLRALVFGLHQCRRRSESGNVSACASAQMQQLAHPTNGLQRR